ncbi:MAG: hypothetical protein LBI95_02335 [Holosporales bacterium]|jgi:peptidoglycan hydrolase CwlO-like protein|nr:hypothetical protein [Holosporales bacterium]
MKLNRPLLALFVMIVTGMNVYATGNFQIEKGNDKKIFEQINRNVLSIKGQLEAFQRKINSLNQEIGLLTSTLKARDLEIEKLNQEIRLLTLTLETRDWETEEVGALKVGFLGYKAQLEQIAEDLEAVSETVQNV